MAGRSVTRALREIVAKRDGYRCYLCGCPTAATLEHVSPCSKSQDSWLSNLRNACPYCNARKGDRPLERFYEQELWRLEPPADLPEDVAAMLEECFGLVGEGIVYTGSVHSRLVLERREVALLVRASARDTWHRFALGASDDPGVSRAAWDFLRRHFARPAAPPPASG